MSKGYFAIFRRVGSSEREEEREEWIGLTAGKQLAAGIAASLRSQGVDVRSQEMLSEGWFLPCTVGAEEFACVVGRESDEYWCISCCSHAGLWASLFRRMDTTKLLSLAEAVDAALRLEAGVTDIRWYKRYPDGDARDRPRDLG